MMEEIINCTNKGKSALHAHGAPIIHTGKMFIYIQIVQDSSIWSYGGDGKIQL